MIGTEQLKADIAYVRAAAERSETVHIRAHGLLWAAILLCGFALVDFVDDPRSQRCRNELILTSPSSTSWGR